MQRIEQERQEEERRKYRPVFSVVGKNADPQKRISIDLSTVENINKITTNKKNKNKIVHHYTFYLLEFQLVHKPCYFV